MAKLDEEHEFDTASRKPSMLGQAITPPKRVQAYLKNQDEFEHLPIAKETLSSRSKREESVPQETFPVGKQDHLNPNVEPFIPIHSANNLVRESAARNQSAHDTGPTAGINDAFPQQREPHNTDVMTRLVNLLSQRNNHDP